MLVITGWYLKAGVVVCIVLVGLTMAAQTSARPTHQVTFIGSGRLRQGVYIMDINRQVVAPYVRESMVGRQTDSTWSPDFNTLVFRAVQNITIDLYAIDLGSRPTHQVTFIGSGRLRQGVYIMDINRQVVAPYVRESMVGRQTDSTWSPDFNTLVFRAVQNITIDLYAIDLGSDQYRQITGTGKNNHSPAFSPDGQWLAFTSERDGNPEIYVISAGCILPDIRCSDDAARRLTDHPKADDQAAWSPDSQQLVFQSNRDGDFEIYTMNLDGSDQRRLTQSPRNDLLPNWSPNGQQIVFASERDINAELYVMQSDGSSQRRLTQTREYEFTPQWSPDGSQILFQRAVPGSDFETYVMDAEGEHEQRLTTVRMFLQNPVWRS